MSKSAAHPATPQPARSGTSVTSADNTSRSQRGQFVTLAVTMAWQLAVVVLVPIIGGVQLDKLFHTSPVLLIVGLVLAVAGSVFVMWQIVRQANRLPVPKLSADQKRTIQEQYDAEDDDA